MEMYDFFHGELKTLKARTGYTQWEKLNDSPKAADEINDLIKYMIDECVKPPFDLVKDEVKQRVISRAIVEDGDFIGLNAKFVRKALNAWWNVYGGKIIEARDESKAPVKVDLDPEADARVNVLLQSFQRSIRNGVFQQVPKITQEEAKQEGDVRPKAHVYHSTDLSYKKQIDERVRKGRELYFRENYPGGSDEDLKAYLASFGD
jgi:hypothetical protein